MTDDLVQRTLYRATGRNPLGKFCLVALAAMPEETATCALLARVTEAPLADVDAALEELVAAGLVTEKPHHLDLVYTLVTDDEDAPMTFSRLKDKLWQTMSDHPDTPYRVFVQMARDAAVKYAGMKGLGTGVKLEDLVISHALGTMMPTRFASSHASWTSHSRWWVLRKKYGTSVVLDVIEYVATYGDPDKGDPLRLAAWVLKDITTNPSGRTAARLSQMRSAA